MRPCFSTLRALLVAICAQLSDIDATEWDIHASGQSGVSLWAEDNRFGGIFPRSTQFHYVADTTLAGRVRRFDLIEASGNIRFAVDPGFNTAVQLGHFEKDGGLAAFTDCVGIRFMEHSAGKLRAQAFIQFNRGAIRQGTSLVLPAGEYHWSYRWDPAGGATGNGHLLAEFAGPVSGSSEIHLGPDQATYFFACNSFGLQTGFLPGAAPESAEIVVSDAVYTTAPEPDLLREHTRVFLLIGQSNARGKDHNVSSLRLAEARDPNILVYVDQWTLACAPSDPLNYFGPEIALGRELAAGLREPVAIVKVTLGGLGLEQEWLPEVERSYNRLIQNTRRALESLQNPVLAGLFSVQGETDSGSQGPAERYAQNLRHLHESVRRDLNAPHLPLIIARLMPFISTPFRDAVRAQQEQFTWIDTDDLTHIGDSLHYDGPSLMEIGRRFGAAYLNLARTPLFWLNFNRLAVLSVPGNTVVLEESEDLVNWTPAPIQIGGAFQRLDPAHPQKFYRIPRN